MLRTRRWLLVVALLGAFALLAAACAPEEEEAEPDPEEPPEEEPEEPEEPDEPDEPEEPEEPDELTSITVGDVLGTPSAFLLFAVEQGFLEDEGLDVTVDPNPGGAANIPGVEAGDFEIAGSNVVSMLLARDAGLELRMVSAGTFATEDPDDDFSQVMVLEDSDIEGPEDLDGRSLAVNTLANIAEVTIRAAMENAGAEHDNVDFVEMGFPEMIPALQEGTVDAVHVIEPFMSIGAAEGARPVLVPYAETEPGMAIGSYFSSDAYIEENPDVVDSFIAGVSAAGDYAADNPDEFREALVEFADLDPDVAEVVNIPPWGGPVHEPSVQLIGDYMVSFGLIDEVPPMEDVTYLP